MATNAKSAVESQSRTGNEGTETIRVTVTDVEGEKIPLTIAAAAATETGTEITETETGKENGIGIIVIENMTGIVTETESAEIGTMVRKRNLKKMKNS